MEPLLWRWGALIQVSSAILIAAYFLVLAFSVRRAELHAWVMAWLMNLAALAITFAFWQLSSRSATMFALASAGYFFAKTQFVVLLVAGATRFALEKPQPLPHRRYGIAIGAFSVIAGLVVGSLDRVGMVQSITTGAILLAGVVAVLRTKAPGWRWLATGFMLRMLFATAETTGYAARTYIGQNALPHDLAEFLVVHGAFDAAAEWVIALGCVFALRGWAGQERMAGVQ